MDEIQYLLDSATSRIGVMMYIMTVHPKIRRIHDTIVRKYRSGVEVYIVLNGGGREPLKYNCETIRYLLSRGLPEECITLTKTRYHTKIVVVDDWVLSGSYNLSASVHIGKTEHAFLVRDRNIANSIYAVVKLTFISESERLRREGLTIENLCKLNQKS